MKRKRPTGKGQRRVRALIVAAAVLGCVLLLVDAGRLVFDDVQPNLVEDVVLVGQVAMLTVLFFLSRRAERSKLELSAIRR